MFKLFRIHSFFSQLESFLCGYQHIKNIQKPLGLKLNHLLLTTHKMCFKYFPDARRKFKFYHHRVYKKHYDNIYMYSKRNDIPPRNLF